MNLLVTGAWADAKSHIATLEQTGHTVCFMQFEKDELPCDYSWVEGVICNGLFQYHQIEKFTNLKYIQLTSAGFDRVPMEYVKSCAIKINNAHGVYSIPMAEYVLAGVLELTKKMRFFADNQKAHKWEKHRGLVELAGKNVCIVGCGSVGIECAKRFAAFGCKVTGVARSERQQEYFDKVVKISDIDSVLPDMDVVVLAVPLTDETRGLMSKSRLALLSADTILVNVARGAIVDEKALIEVLPNIFGAVLDVFTEEPLSSDSPLWDMENVIVTPHNSFVGEGNGERVDDAILRSLI